MAAKPGLPGVGGFPGFTDASMATSGVGGSSVRGTTGELVLTGSGDSAVTTYYVLGAFLLGVWLGRYL